MDGLTSANFVTDTNKQPLVMILTLFFLSSGIICVLARLYTKWVVIPFVALDDYFVPVATVFMIAQSMAVTTMLTNGYGRPGDEISLKQRATILRAEYAAMLLYIPSLFFSKISTLVILNLISPDQRLHRQLIAASVAILAWAVTSEIVSAFQCRPLDTWDYRNGQCMDRSAFITYFESVNGFTDVLLVLIPIMVVSGVRTSIRRKFSVLIVFCVRLVTVGAIVAKLVLLWRDTDGDPFFSNWSVTICTQLIQLLSLMSTCVLYLRPFLDALTSGFINGDDLRRRGQLRPYKVELEDYSDGFSSSMTKTAGHVGYSGHSGRTETRSTNEAKHPKKEEYKQEDPEPVVESSPVPQHTPDRSMKYSGSWLQSRTESEMMEEEHPPQDEPPMPDPAALTAWPLPPPVEHPPAEIAAHNQESSSDSLPEPRRSIASEFERRPPHGQSPASDSVRVPVRSLPLNAHGLPRVSMAYSPLENADNIQTFLTEEELRDHIR